MNNEEYEVKLFWKFYERYPYNASSMRDKTVEIKNRLFGKKIRLPVYIMVYFDKIIIKGILSLASLFIFYVLFLI